MLEMKIVWKKRINGTTKRIDFTFDFVYLFIQFQSS